MGWDLAPAGFTDDYTGTIADLVFQPGNFGTEAVVTIALDEPFTANDGTLVNSRTLYLGITDGWEAQPDGSIAKPGDPDAKLKSNGCKWVKFAERVIELAPELREQIPGGVTSTEGWAGGFRFHFMTEGAGKDYKFTDKATGEVKEGKTKGQVMPVEYLGTVDNPVAGSVGASTNGHGFDISVIPTDVFAALDALKDSENFASDALKSGLVTKEKLGDAYGKVTGALGDGSLQKALQPF